MSYAATAQDEAEDRYYTQIEAGDVRLFTLDQLDAAFNAGLIHENTYVCLEGDAKWLTLGEVAGLGEEFEPPPPPPSPSGPRYSTQPRSIVPAPYSVAPVIVPPSIAPVVNDLAFDAFDPDLLALRPKRRAGKVVAGLGALGLCGLALAVSQSGSLGLPKLRGANAAAASLSPSHFNAKESANPTASPQTPVAPSDAPKPVGASGAPTPVTASSPAGASEPSRPAVDQRFSDEMKEALLKKDKKQAIGQQRKKAARVAQPARRRNAKSSTGFKSGGSSYDPLNGKL